jgi:hypothetical protein
MNSSWPTFGGGGEIWWTAHTQNRLTKQLHEFMQFLKISFLVLTGLPHCDRVADLTLD